MSEELNDNLALQNIVTLQLITSMNSLTIGLTVITSNFKIQTNAMIAGFRSITDETFDFNKVIGQTQDSFKQLNSSISGIGSTGSSSAKKSNPLEKFGNSLDSGIQSFKSLGSSMLSLTFVMKPISGFLGGLLEPFEVITDMFGSFGEILGTGLVPLGKIIVDLLSPLLPVIVIVSENIGVLTGGLSSVVSSAKDWVGALVENTKELIEARRATEELRVELTGERAKSLERGGYAGKEVGLRDL